MTISNTFSFFWEATFEDGFKFSQFNPDGSENVVKEFMGPKLQALHAEKKSIIGKNVFAGLESTHGKVRNFGFYPFEHEFANTVRGAHNGISIAESNQVPEEIIVPLDSYPLFYRTSALQYVGVKPNKREASLHLGLVKRVDEESHSMYKSDKSSEHREIEVIDK